MGYGVFSAAGTVTSVEEVATRGGTEGVRVLIETHESEYRGERVTHRLEATAWGRAAEQARGIGEGDEVAIAGSLESKISNSGYWNARVTAREVVVLNRAQQPAQAAPAPAQQQAPQQPAPGLAPAPQPALYDDDIPF